MYAERDMDQKSEVPGQGNNGETELMELHGEEWEQIREGKLPKERHQAGATARELALKRQIQALEDENKRLKEEKARLAELASKDSLTGLDNHRSFDEELPKALASAIRRNESVALLYLDLDNLKKTNDGISHQAGDVELQEVATILCGQLRPGDVVFRLGGDEFAVILPASDKNGAIGISERLRKAVEAAEISFEDKETQIKAAIKATTSIGITSFRPLADMDQKQDHTDLIVLTAERMIAVADQGLLGAKSNGRNRVGFIADDNRLAILGPDPNNPANMIVTYPEPLLTR